MALKLEDMAPGHVSAAQSATSMATMQPQQQQQAEPAVAPAAQPARVDDSGSLRAANLGLWMFFYPADCGKYRIAILASGGQKSGGE